MARSKQFARIERRLKAIPVAVKAAVMPAMETSANEIVAAAKALCPVDSGDLRDSIGWTWGDAPEGSIVLASTEGGALRITIYAGDDDAFYARWVEFGTVKLQSHPYFLPAYRLLKKRSARRIKRAISKAVRQNWGSA
jgi:HK97 gp10 family phage protein